MNVKQKINIVIFSLVAMCTFAFVPLVAHAAEKKAPLKNCGVETAIIKCPTNIDNSGGTKNNGVWGLLLIALNILTAGVGVVAVGGIAYGAILYTTAGDKADQVQKAVGVITNVVIGIIAYVGMFALLQFLIPGGVFQ